MAIYHRPPGEPVFRLTALEVLRIEGDRVAEIVDFDVPGLHTRVRPRADPPLTGSPIPFPGSS